MKYAQMYVLQKGKVVEAIASDSILHLDGRWNLFTCKRQIESYINSMEKLKDFVGYSIHQGERYSTSYCINAFVEYKANS